MKETSATKAQIPDVTNHFAHFTLLKECCKIIIIKKIILQLIVPILGFQCHEFTAQVLFYLLPLTSSLLVEKQKNNRNKNLYSILLKNTACAYTALKITAKLS